LQAIHHLRQTQKDNLRLIQSKVDEFARVFVPIDIDEEDISHYVNNLVVDEVHIEYFPYFVIFL
jgi:hypothetical protein